MEFASALLESLKDVVQLLHQEEFEFCLVDGLAVSILSTPRATEDIDILLSIAPTDKARLINAIEKRFTIIQNKENTDFSFGSIWRLILGKPNDIELIVLDFILAESETLQRALRNPILITLDGVRIPVASPEALIAMKMNSTRKKDQADVQALLHLTP